MWKPETLLSSGIFCRKDCTSTYNKKPSNHLSSSAKPILSPPHKRFGDGYFREAVGYLRDGCSPQTSSVSLLGYPAIHFLISILVNFMNFWLYRLGLTISPTSSEQYECQRRKKLQSIPTFSKLKRFRINTENPKDNHGLFPLRMLRKLLTFWHSGIQ